MVGEVPLIIFPGILTSEMIYIPTHIAIEEDEGERGGGGRQDSVLFFTLSNLVLGST